MNLPLIGGRPRVRVCPEHVCCPALTACSCPSVQGGSGARHRHVMASFATPLDPSHVDRCGWCAWCSLPGRWCSRYVTGRAGRRHQLDPRRRADRLPVADARLAVARARPAQPDRRASPSSLARGQLRRHRRRCWTSAGWSRPRSAPRPSCRPWSRWPSTAGGSATTTSLPTARATSWRCSQASVVGVLVALPLGPAPGIWLTSSGLRHVRVERR